MRHLPIQAGGPNYPSLRHVFIISIPVTDKLHILLSGGDVNSSAFKTKSVRRPPPPRVVFLFSISGKRRPLMKLFTCVLGQSPPPLLLNQKTL